jgi:glutamate-1-semialdehyde 2,1-aminomutase
MDRLKVSKKLFTQAKKVLVGGVNSPVRSFKYVGGNPVFIKKAKKARIYSEESKEFIDYCLCWGSLILGHSHPEVIASLKETVDKGISFGMSTKLEIDLSKIIICALPSIELLRFTNSGTEATMTTIRLARAYTKKNKIIKFEGSYHGHADYLLVKTGSGQASLGIPKSLGVPKDFVKHTIVLPYNDIKKVKMLCKKYQKDLAAIIVEPIQANCGVILPKEGFLGELRNICDRFNIILIFDEIITGFRLSWQGAQGYFKVKPDLTCLGKIIGGGLPIGAVGGKREIMKLLAPQGDVYQAGTFSGNPLTMVAGIRTLEILRKSNPYKKLEENTKKLCETIKEIAKKYGFCLKVNYISSLFSIFFTNREVERYEDVKSQNMNLFKKFFHALLKEGVYFSPSGFEANFLSLAHEKKEIEDTLEAVEIVFKKYLRR